VKTALLEQPAWLQWPMVIPLEIYGQGCPSGMVKEGARENKLDVTRGFNGAP
jgi:hypothetical protein